MTETARLRLPLIAAAQAQKHVTHNEALTALDTLVQAAALDKDLSAPPGSPTEGDCYIVATGGSGAWTGFDKRIVRFIDGMWRSYIPGNGWTVFVLDEEAFYVFDGANWEIKSGGVATAGAPVVAGRFASYADTSGNLIEDSGFEPGDFQPLDADLTAIAALTTQSYGRSLLALADAAALRTAAGLVIGTDVQAFDSDLAAIAALSTTSFGRSLLTLADAAAALQTLGTWRILAASAVASSHTGNTTETTLATIQVPANAMGPNGILRITAVFNFDGSAGNRMPRIKFGGTTYFGPVLASSRFGFRVQVQIANRNNAASQSSFNAGTAGGAFGEQTVDAQNPLTSAIDTTQNQDIVLTGQLVNGADTISLESYLIELLHKA